MRSAKVLFKDRLAGTLSETLTGGTRFAYERGWTEDIACCYPVTRNEYDWPSGLHPFFQHLGPEGWLREQQARGAHVDGQDDLGLLLRYGSDCIGAVSVCPPESSELPVAAAEATTNPGRTVSGIQKKLLVVRGRDGFVPAGATGPAPYIAKFNSESIPTLVRNEALSLRWTGVVLGAKEVNEFQSAPVGDEYALIVTRFDRGPKGEKLRLEDCAQILAKPRGQDYGGKYDAAYEDVATIIKSHSSRPVIDIQRFFHRLVAFALVGNCDAHLKNFSLLETPTGLRLSPAYDVLNTAIYDGFDQTLALSIRGKQINLGAADGELLRGFGRDIGLSDRVIDRTLQELKRQVAKASAVIKPPAAEGPDGFVTRYSEIVSNQCLRILGE
ncbi:phosphatidylinositol kinase [Mesorhizobium sp. SARCC-RB16n]|uniref:type II toxin-antitoxin system HipA family toxin n=1 Tax=Mesorhizobium sp. SARCC-RB16n TaxID=2116687 RepID=UPI00122F0D15|nr:HipA domain-containing protein [Mesorhizobium sp. SARCC-RB16n]KAA3448362.1 phosphatidylinositol kinase [Mesorhizobium sp. SARCC-RB16n]